MTNKIFSLIKEGVQGSVSAIEEDLKAASYDFGRTVYKQPLIVVKPVCEQDIIHCLQVSKDLKIPLSIQGGGHSCIGQTLNEGGIFLANFADKAEFQVQEGNKIEVSARSSWRLLEQELNKVGRSAPVHTDYLDLSVGGTLAVGGYGLRSIINGSQIDHVEKLRLIQPDGTAIWCSPCENSELFRYTLAGLGKVGIIERIVMRTVPYKKFARMYLYYHESVADFIASLAWLLTSESETLPDTFYSFKRGDVITSRYGLEFDDEGEKYIHRYPVALLSKMPAHAATMVDYPFIMHKNRTEEVYARFPNHTRHWADYIFDFDGFYAYLQYIDSLFQDDLTTRYLAVEAIYAIRRTSNKVQAPFAAHAIQSDSPFVFTVGTYFMVPVGDTKGYDHVQYILQKEQDKAFELEGRPYRFGWHKLSRSTKKLLYGDDFTRFEQIQQTLDPHNFLNPGVH